MSRKSRQTEAFEQDGGGNVAVLDSEATSAQVLIDHLAETGTPSKVVDGMRLWLRTNQDANAETLYRHLEATGVKSGTLRKAGKFVFGSDFEPESVVMQAPEEEITRLREENERLKTNNQTLSAEKLGLANQNTHLLQRINELQSQVGFLKIGKTPEELKTVGL